MTFLIFAANLPYLLFLFIMPWPKPCTCRLIMLNCVAVLFPLWSKAWANGPPTASPSPSGHLARDEAFTWLPRLMPRGAKTLIHSYMSMLSTPPHSHSPSHRPLRSIAFAPRVSVVVSSLSSISSMPPTAPIVYPHQVPALAKAHARMHSSASSASSSSAATGWRLLAVASVLSIWIGTYK